MSFWNKLGSSDQLNLGLIDFKLTINNRNVGYNQIYGDIPSDISNLKNLRKLYVSLMKHLDFIE